MDMASEMDARNVGTYDEYQRTCAENERLRAEVERLRGELEFETAENDFDCGGVRARLRAATARAEAAEALVAGLRGTLELLLKCSALGVAIPWGRAVATLAITPASAGNRIKAEAYREAARLVDSCSAETLHREADRMEKEGANGR